MKKLNTLSRILVGLVFIFSGFVKAIDPLGSTYKFTDYFVAFGMESLSFLALPLALLMSALEFGIGFSLLFNTLKKLTSWFLLIFMSFFTVLTFILAIFNPVTDCGCFGDAIVITNWQTFGKNIILMIFTVIIFYNRDKFKLSWSSDKQSLVASLPVFFSLLLSVYCFRNLPIIDFRPYSVGTNIPEKMIIPDDAPKAEYKTVLIYEKDGVQKEFDLQNLPDSTWEWKETKNTLVSEGYVPPIHDFTISSLNGDDVTDYVLNDNKFTFLLIAYDLNKASLSKIQEIFSLYHFSEKEGANFICLTASVQSDIKNFIDKTKAPFAFFNTDETTLKTMIRSNPGLILIKNGTILGKWHYRNIPSNDEISEKFLKNNKYKNSDDSDEVLAYKY